jgi:beta-aspartyl-peptidase (threonine type)
MLDVFLKPARQIDSMNRLLQKQRIFMLLSVFGMLSGLGAAADAEIGADANGRWAIALHGGAGRIARDLDPKEKKELTDSLTRAISAGKEILSKGGSALDAAQAVVVNMEDNPRFNAGKGAVFTRAGTHELDAAIIDGSTLRCGAVAAIKFQKNPIRIARLVMERTPHVLLVGEGADAFAVECGFNPVEQKYFYTERRFRELQEALAKQKLPSLPKPAYKMSREAEGAKDDSGLRTKGTVGCVALDTHGNLAAATSTGGVNGKRPGRVGDSPIIGAGTYANKTCAVSCTGAGEQFIRHSIAARVAMLMEERKLAVDEAARICIEEVLQPGDGGLIAVDRNGKFSLRSSTGGMPRAIADSTGRMEIGIWFSAK